MGKGAKDKARFILNDHSQPKGKKGMAETQNQERVSGPVASRSVVPSPPSGILIPPGIPECDVILKGNKRFWYLESVLFLFGIGGFIISAILLIRHYSSDSQV